MWDLPRPGLEPESPALAGGFLTTAPPGKPNKLLLLILFTHVTSWGWCDEPSFTDNATVSDPINNLAKVIPTQGWDADRGALHPGGVLFLLSFRSGLFLSLPLHFCLKAEAEVTLGGDSREDRVAS